MLSHNLKREHPTQRHKHRAGPYGFFIFRLALPTCCRRRVCTDVCSPEKETFPVSKIAMLHAFVAVLMFCAAPAQAQSFKETLGWMHQSSAYHAFVDATDNALESTQVPLTNTCTNFVIIQER